MYTLLLLLQNPSMEPLPCKELQDNGFFTVVSSIDDILLTLKNYDPNDTLVVTDSDDASRTALKKRFPVIGFERDGQRLSCREIIDSADSLTPEYCLEQLLFQSGRMPAYSDDTITLFPVSENEFLEAYEHFRKEPYMLTDEQKSLDRSGVITLYWNRQALSQFTDSLGSFRAESRGITVGFGSIYQVPDNLTFLIDPQSGSKNSAAALSLMTVDYYVLPAHRRKGFGTAIVRALTSLANSQSESHDLYAYVNPANTASLRTLEACVFSRIGTVTSSSGNTTSAVSPNTITTGTSRVQPETPQVLSSQNHGHGPESNEFREPALYVYCLRGHQ